MDHECPKKGTSSIFLSFWMRLLWVDIDIKTLSHVCAYQSLISTSAYLHTRGSTLLRAHSTSRSSALRTGQWSRWKHPLGIDRTDSCPFETCPRRYIPRCWIHRLALFLKGVKANKDTFEVISEWCPFVFPTASRKFWEQKVKIW